MSDIFYQSNDIFSNFCSLFNGHSRPLFIFVFSIHLYSFKTMLQMTGFEPRISDVGSDLTTNYATIKVHRFSFSKSLFSPFQHFKFEFRWKWEKTFVLRASRGSKRFNRKTLLSEEQKVFASNVQRGFPESWPNLLIPRTNN